MWGGSETESKCKKLRTRIHSYILASFTFILSNNEIHEVYLKRTWTHPRIYICNNHFVLNCLVFSLNLQSPLAHVLCFTKVIGDEKREYHAIYRCLRRPPAMLSPVHVLSQRQPPGEYCSYVLNPPTHLLTYLLQHF